MTAATALLPWRRPSQKSYGSMSNDRQWALRWSYFFLVLFAIFFLTPPLYMLITSLKTSQEISAITNPWWVFNPTLDNYASCCVEQLPHVLSQLVDRDHLGRHITMLISVPAAFALSRMRFWGSTILGIGVFLTYLIPETLLFIPLFKMMAVFNELTGIALINSGGCC